MDQLISQYDLFVFDFDLTILKRHSYNEEITVKNVEEKSWKQFERDFADLIFFKDLVSKIVNRKKKVAIVSFGTYNVIKAYLDRGLGKDLFFHEDNIKTPLEGDQRYTRHFKPDDNKNQYLIDLSIETGVPYCRTIFFDDSFKNVQSAVRDLGVKGIHVTNFLTPKLIHDLINPQEKEDKFPGIAWKVKNKNIDKSTKKHDPEIEGFQDNVQSTNKMGIAQWIMEILAVILIGFFLINKY